MPEVLIESRQALGAIAESLESMAFISLMPAESPYAPPADPILLLIAFYGNVNGTIELATSARLGRLIIAGVMGVDANDIDAGHKPEDALKELMNVTAGKLLRELDGSDNINISLPTSDTQATDTRWLALVSSEGAAVADAEGCLLAVKVTVSN